MPDTAAGRDIIVVGASAGGIEALSRLLAGLPAELPAAVLIVQHLAEGRSQRLSSILGRAGALPVAEARDGEPIRPGRVYLAPSDLHLLVRPGVVHLAHTPRENRHRPSIDALFRSAAQAYGPRVVGAVLTGTRDDGTAGLLMVKARGGVAVVQDPADATYPGMPESALRHVAVDHCVPLEAMPALLVGLASTPPLPGKGAEDDLADSAPVPSGQSCPTCHGPLWERHEGPLIRFECRIGHAFSAQSLLGEQAEALETALWGAVRALQESAALERRLLAKAPGWLAPRYAESAVAKETQARLIRQMLLGSGADPELAGAPAPAVHCGDAPPK